MQCSELLKSVEDRFVDQLARGREVAKRLREEDLNRSPGPGKWSIGQIFEHMILSALSYEQTMKSAVETAAKGASAEIRHTMFGKFIIKSAGPEGNSPAPKPFVPKNDHHTMQIVEKWIAQTEGFLALARKAHGIDLCSYKIKNPIIPIFKMNLADCFEILAEHTERHIRQIEALADRSRTTA